MLNEVVRQITTVFNMIFSDSPTNGGAVASVLAQIFFIGAILYAVYKKFIKGTSSEKLVKGIFMLIVAWLLGELLSKMQLHILGAFLKVSITIIAISLVIIFQPELRRFLSYIGQTDFWKKALWNNDKKGFDVKVNMLQELTETVKYLSKTKTGGLIVLQDVTSHASFSEVGTKINARVSAELLLTIFFPNTPLHDGAVVIKDEKIVAAGVLLPLTEDPKLSWRYGTRHRAAIGVTEVNDCACIVVSEETGDISIALDGVLKKYEAITDFKTDLKSILKIEDEEKEIVTKKKLNFINFKSKENQTPKV